MCGIVAKFNKQKDSEVNSDIADLFDDQRSRGTQGFGFVAIDEHMNITMRKAKEETKILADLYRNDVPAIMFHHRFPTSTDNTRQQAHPMLVMHDEFQYDYLVVHNGVIRNADELQEIHEDEGFDYFTLTEEETKKWVAGKYVTKTQPVFNDSESLAIEVALFVEGKSEEIKTEGSAAFIAIAVCKETWKAERIWFGRNNLNQLNLLETESGITLSSQGPGNAIEPYVLHSFVPFKNTITKQPLKFVTPAVPVPTKDASNSKAVTVANKTANKTATTTPVVGFTPKTTGAAAVKTTGGNPWSAKSTGSTSEQAQKIFDRVDSINDDFDDDSTRLITEVFMKTLDDDAQARMAMDDLSFEHEEILRETVLDSMCMDIENKLKLNGDYDGRDIIRSFAIAVKDYIADIHNTAEEYYVDIYENEKAFTK